LIIFAAAVKGKGIGDHEVSARGCLSHGRYNCPY